MLPSKNEVTEYANTRYYEFVQFAREKFEICDSIPFWLEIQNKGVSGYTGLGGYRLAKKGKLEGPFIRLEIHDIINYPVLAYNEYASIKKISGLQSFETNDWKEWLDALILHELAHAIQYAMYFRSHSFGTLVRSDNVLHFKYVGSYEKGHSNFFKRIYFILREKFLNYRIKNKVFYSKTINNFDKPVTSKLKTDHRFVGRTVKLNDLGVCKVVGHNPRAKKYPFIVETAGKKRYKVPETAIVSAFI